MKNSELHKIIEKWLEDPNNQEHSKKVEESIKDNPISHNSFRELQRDFIEFKASNKIPENPFFFSKLKFRMENRKQERSHIQRVRWAVYTATLSVSLVVGILLGEQVEYNQSSSSETITSTDDIFIQEFMVADYSIDNTLLIDFSE